MALRVLGLRASHPAQHAHCLDHGSSSRQRLTVASARAESSQNGTVTAVMTRQQLQLRVAAKVIPHPQKAHYGGEDAHFVSAVGGGAIGVADGVGGWNESGISPAEYSRTFMETARKFMEGELNADATSSSTSTNDWMSLQPTWDGVLSSDSDSEGVVTAELNGSGAAGEQPAPSLALDAKLANGTALPSNGAQNGTAALASAAAQLQNGKMEGVEQLQEGCAAPPAQQQQVATAEPPAPSLPRTPLQALDIAHQTTRLPGSATACILYLDGERGILNAANVGDSGFLVLRAGEVVFQSPALQHFFDCPYQFGAFPEHAEATDSAEDAGVYDIEVQPGDVIILATDGLLDNCYTEEIVRLAPTSSTHVEQAAAALAELASQHANDPDFESPYTEEAAQEGFDIPIWEKVFNASFKDGKVQLGKLRGGKLDDITVVVAYVEAVGSS